MYNEPQMPADQEYQVYQQQQAQQSQEQQRRQRMGIPPQLDPRKAMGAMHMDREKMLQAQAVARAQAQAASTVVIATIVSLITSAFGFVAALAWNDALNQLFIQILPQTEGFKLASLMIRAVLVSIIAVIAIVILNRVAGRFAQKSALQATTLH